MPLQQRNLVLPLVIAIGAILAGGYVIQEQQAERAAAEARVREKNAVPVVKPKDPAQQYIASVRTALAANFLRASAAARAYMSVVGPLPEVATPGWKFGEVNCTAGACQVTWARVDKARATNTVLSAARGTKVHFLTDLKSAQERLDVASMPDVIPDLSALPKAQEFLLTTGSRFQVMKRAGLSVTLASGGNGNTLELAGKWPEGSSPPADTLLIRTGTWEIKGDYALRSALLELPENMSLSLLNVQAKGAGAGVLVAPTAAAQQQTQIEFTASGSFYVR